MTLADKPARSAELNGRSSGRISHDAWGWIIADAGRTPQLLVISTFVFVPYVAATLIGDPLHAQVFLARCATIGGLIAAVTAPLVAIGLDRPGVRKPWLIGLTLVTAVLLAALWWVQPGGALSALDALIIVTAINLLQSYFELAHASMPPAALGDGRAPSSLAFGNLISAVVLGFMLWGLFLPGAVLASLVPSQPLFGLDPLLFEPERFSGPLIALVLVATTLPALMATSDWPATDRDARWTWIAGFHALGAAIRAVTANRKRLVFVIARTAYIDGMTALVLFGGVIAVGLFPQNVIQRVGIGVLLTFGAVIGAFLAEPLEQILGARRTIWVQVGFISVWMLAQIVRPALAPFASKPVLSMIYLAMAVVGSAAIVAALSSSRGLSHDQSTPDEHGADLGIFAVSVAATAWVAPLLIGLCTATFHSQAAGIAPIALLFFGGLIGMTAGARP